MHEATALQEEAVKLRALLALLFAGHESRYLYADDGELQDNRGTPCIDFKRDSVELIAFKIRERKRNETSHR
jgi:hypothetical protein